MQAIQDIHIHVQRVRNLVNLVSLVTSWSNWVVYSLNLMSFPEGQNASLPSVTSCVLMSSPPRCNVLSQRTLLYDSGGWTQHLTHARQVPTLLQGCSLIVLPASWPGNIGPSWALWDTRGISAPHTYPVLSPLNREPLDHSKEANASRLQIEMTRRAFFRDTSPTYWFLLEKHRLFSILKELQHIERSMVVLSEGKLHLELAPI